MILINLVNDISIFDALNPKWTQFFQQFSIQFFFLVFFLYFNYVKNWNISNKPTNSTWNVRKRNEQPKQKTKFYIKRSVLHNYVIALGALTIWKDDFRKKKKNVLLLCEMHSTQIKIMKCHIHILSLYEM